MACAKDILWTWLFVSVTIISFCPCNNSEDGIRDGLLNFVRHSDIYYNRLSGQNDNGNKVSYEEKLKGNQRSEKLITVDGKLATSAEESTEASTNLG